MVVGARRGHGLHRVRGEIRHARRLQRARGGALAGAAQKAAGAVEGAKDKAAEAFTKLRGDAVAALEPRMADAREQVSKLKGKVADLPAAVRPTVESGLKEIEKQLGAADEQFGKLKAAGADTWESLSKDLSGTSTGS